MDLSEILNQKLFLGQEFLTWLWRLSEEEGGLEIKDLGWVQVMLGERMVLAPSMGAEGARVTVSGPQSSLAEAREGLRQGKLVEALRLGLEIQGEEYWLTVSAAELSMGGLKLPSHAPGDEGPQDAEGLVLERVALIENALNALDGLFKAFLEIRLDPAQGPGLRQDMGAWAAQMED